MYHTHPHQSYGFHKHTGVVTDRPPAGFYPTMYQLYYIERQQTLDVRHRQI